MDSAAPRRRVGAGATADKEPSAPKASKADSKGSSGGVNFVDILRGIVGLLIFTAAMSWFITGESLIFDYRKAPTIFGAVKRYFVCTCTASCLMHTRD